MRRRRRGKLLLRRRFEGGGARASSSWCYRERERTKRLTAGKKIVDFDS